MDDVVKRMAELLRQGAAMLAYSCPECGVPLFRLKSGQVICPKCNREVVTEAGRERAKARIREIVISELEEALSKKLHELAQSLNEGDYEDLLKKLTVIERIISILAKLEK